MRKARRSQSITRREAIGQMAAAAALPSVGNLRCPTEWPVGSARIGRAAQPLSTGGAIRLERQPTGAEIWQVTTQRFSQSNIYCEVPYCSADSRYFVYQRQNPKLSGNRTEWMVVELGTWNQHRLDVGTGTSGCAISPGGVFHYLKQGGGRLDLKRADLSHGISETIYSFGDAPRPRSLGTVSADGRYYASGCRADDKWKLFGIMLVDLKTGRQAIIDRDPFILNPHPQFEPGKSKQLMVQHNRGGTFLPDGKLLRLVGPEGATLYLLSVPDGKRTELQVGRPFTTPCTGHEAWIGKTEEMLLSVSAREEYAAEKGNLLGVRADQPARVVAKGYRFNHVGVSRCGRFFCCDDWQRSYKLVIGSITTGKTAVVCDSKTSPGRSQNTHPHGYLTPDLKWVIFNSNRSGHPHVHAASVPEQMIKDLS